MGNDTEQYHRYPVEPHCRPIAQREEHLVNKERPVDGIVVTDVKAFAAHSTSLFQVFSREDVTVSNIRGIGVVNTICPWPAERSDMKGRIYLRSLA